MFIKSSDYLNTLNICSFKGIPFIWRATNHDTGNDFKIDEYVGSNQDVNTTKPQYLGRKRAKFIVTLEPIEQTIQAKDILIKTLVENGDPGELILPDYSSVSCIPASVSINNQLSLINQYVFDVEFIRAGELTFPLSKNTQGNLENNEDIARNNIINNLLDKINNVNLASIQANFLALTSGNIYDFINNNALLSAIRNVDEILDTINQINNNADNDATNSPIGASGQIPDRRNLNDLTLDKNIILSKINNPQSLATTVGNIYTELSITKYVNDSKALELFNELSNIEFEQTDKRFDLVQNKNAETLEYFNRKLALLQYCVIAVRKEYKLQEEINQVISNIIIIQEKLLDFTIEDIIEINEIVNSTFDILKTQKSALYRIDEEYVDNQNIISLTYILFNEVKDEEIQALKDINPDLDYGSLNGKINIIVDNV